MIPVAARDGQAAATWEAAVEAAADLLVDLGVASSAYPRACVEIVREHGPYIVLAPGLALVHARPEAGGQALGVACLRLATPVAFGHQENDPVDLLISFCSPDEEQHVSAVSALGKALMHGLAERLRRAPESSAVKEYLEESLK